MQQQHDDGNNMNHDRSPTKALPLNHSDDMQAKGKRTKDTNVINVNVNAAAAAAAAAAADAAAAAAARRHAAALQRCRVVLCPI